MNRPYSNMATRKPLSLLEVIAILMTLGLLSWLVLSLLTFSSPAEREREHALRAPAVAMGVFTAAATTISPQLQALPATLPIRNAVPDANTDLTVPLEYDPVTHPLQAAIEFHRRQAAAEADAARRSPFSGPEGSAASALK